MRLLANPRLLGMLQWFLSAINIIRAAWLVKWCLCKQLSCDSKVGEWSWKGNTDSCIRGKWIILGNG